MSSFAKRVLDNGAKVVLPESLKRAIAADVARTRWIKCQHEDVASDELTERYKGFDICLIVPNGGICGVSVALGDEAYQTSTVLENRYHDRDWHVAIAREFIDSIVGVEP